MSLRAGFGAGFGRRSGIGNYFGCGNDIFRAKTDDFKFQVFIYLFFHNHFLHVIVSSDDTTIHVEERIVKLKSNDFVIILQIFFRYSENRRRMHSNYYRPGASESRTRDR